jgi:hypothetical protein
MHPLRLFSHRKEEGKFLYKKRKEEEKEFSASDHA